MSRTDYTLWIRVREPVEPPNPLTRFDEHPNGLWCKIDARFGSTLAVDAVRILGDRGARMVGPRDWRMWLDSHPDEEPVAYELVDACPESVDSHRLSNPPADFDETAPHPTHQFGTRLRAGVSPNVGRRPRGEFGFVHEQPIAHRTVVRLLEDRFGVRRGPEVLLRGEPSEWFTVDLDATPVIDAEFCSRLHPCFNPQPTDREHRWRADLGLLIARDETPDEFGWRYDATGWGCDDYTRRTMIDQFAHDFLFPRGRKRPGDFAANPIFPPDGEVAAFLRQLDDVIESSMSSAD